MANAWRKQRSRKQPNERASRRRRPMDEARPVLQLPIAEPRDHEPVEVAEPARETERGVAVVDFYI